MVGLTVAASNYFIFIAILFVFSFVMNQQLAIFTATAANKSGVQAAASVILLFFVVFCGFLVVPEVIPDYYTWLYWWNPLAWVYRALLVNEFLSPDYDMMVEGSDQTVGERILTGGGQIYKGSTFGREWIGYAFAYLVPYGMLCTIIQSLCLEFVRVEPRASPSPEDDKSNVHHSALESQDDSDAVQIPFIPVTLTFTNICYDVKASKGKETIRLLNNVNGIFSAGRMCALMGSSGVCCTLSISCLSLWLSLLTLVPFCFFCRPERPLSWYVRARCTCSAFCLYAVEAQHSTFLVFLGCDCIAQN